MMPKLRGVTNIRLMPGAAWPNAVSTSSARNASICAPITAAGSDCARAAPGRTPATATAQARTSRIFLIDPSTGRYFGYIRNGRTTRAADPPPRHGAASAQDKRDTRKDGDAMGYRVERDDRDLGQTLARIAREEAARARAEIAD